MKEIPVSKRNILVAVLLAVGLAVGILMIQNWPLRTAQGSIPTASEDDLAAVAAVSAMEAVFQIDYQGDKAAWLSRICEVSTPAGCALFSSGADPMWQKYVEAKSVVTAEAQALEKVGDNGAEQIWQVDIRLSAPLPGSNKTADTA